MHSKQVEVKGLMFDAAVAPFVPYMGSVNSYRDTLQRLQDVWDQLTLLGQMSGIASDITSTATEFASLTTNMLNFLARRQMHEANHAMRAKAQVAIDVLVRNLFERTADVGFLATDTAVRDYLEALPKMDAAEQDAARLALERRFRAYVAKYSVYDDVLVLSPQGQVLARLDGAVAQAGCTHELVRQSMEQAFVETFGQLDVMGGRRTLMYSAAIRSARGGQALGVLGLSFRFDDEMRGIFAQLAPAGQAGVVALLDARGQVLASSDAWQIPVGAPLPVEPDGQLHRVYFAGRDYLAVAVRATPYQGYPGPGWVGCTLVPLAQAFQLAETAAAAAPPVNVPEGTLFSGSLFEDDLRRIPQQALRIQRGLERSVWNGEVRGRRSSDRNGSESRFAAALLRQVTVTGARIKTVFEDAIGQLQKLAVASILEEARFRSALAMDIMDRNLYERANDCRWWALDGSLQKGLMAGGPDSAGAQQAAAVLGHINSLYTVYALLLLLDAQGQVVATSRNDARAWLGRRLDASWVRPVFALGDDQAFARSRFEATALYGDQPTYIYAAAIRAGDGPVLGGTAIVFDSTPQFEAMLRDSLPIQPDGKPMAGSSGLFVTRAGQVVSSTDPAYAVGSTVGFMDRLPRLARGESRSLLLDIDGAVYAAGVSMAGGYREYGSGLSAGDDDVASLILIRICEHSSAAAADGTAARAAPQLAEAAVGARDEVIEIASFFCGGQWLGLPVKQVVAAFDVVQLTALLGSVPSMAGVLMHEDAAVPVIDLHALRTGTSAGKPGGRTMVLCVCADGSRMGLLVDELSGIYAAPAQAMQAMPDYLAAHDPYARAMLRGCDAARSLLMLLDVNALYAVLRTGVTPAVGFDAIAAAQALEAPRGENALSAGEAAMAGVAG